MSAHKSIDKICAIVTVLTLLLAVVFCNGKAFGIETTAHAIGYENRLFDHSRVHTIDIVMNDWDSFIAGCESEEYTPCNLVIDGEAVRNVGIRGKGNTSLSSVKNMDSDRYSFKIEFDQYDKTKSYHGLDKLCLNNIIQDNTYMKDYLAYTLMEDFGVDAPLCSYAYLTVNGEDWGLYLAVEAIEESFLTRNYGSNYGDLYKPDSMSFGGGRGNGRDFSMSDFIKENTDSEENAEDADSSDTSDGKQRFSFPGGGNMQDFGGEMPEGFDPSQMGGDLPEGVDPSSFDFSDFDPSQMGGEGGNRPNFGGGFGGGFGMGSADVKLQYIDDNPSSYSNIFSSAKTASNTADQKRLIRSLQSLSTQSDLEDVLDTEEVLRYFVVHNFLCNGDSYTGQMIHNYYLYEEDGQLSMIPWDYNLAFGSFQGGDATSSVNSPIDTPVSGDMSDRPMVAWIFGSEDYTAQYHALFSEFLSSCDVDALIVETAALIDEYVEKDPTKFCTYEEYLKGVETIRTFCALRTESVQGQLDGSIPATTDGQNADSSALVDASGLTISDMGSMNNGGGGFGGGPGGGFGGGNPFGRSRGDQSEEAAPSDDTGLQQQSKTKTQALAGNRQPPNGGGGRPDFNGQPPEGFDPSQIPEGFDPSQIPEGFDGQPPEGFDGQMPESFDGQMPEDFDGQTPEDFDGQMPEGFDGQAPTDSAEDDSKSSASVAERSRDERPSMNQFPGMPLDNSQTNPSGFILLGASALALLLGLLFAALFKR